MTQCIDDSIKFLTSLYFILDLNQLYFRLLLCPEYFGFGYNSFLISINSLYFRSDTIITVKLFDMYNNVVSLNTSNILEKDSARIYTYISSLLEIGMYTICIVGCIESTITGVEIPKQYLNIYNIRFKKQIYVNPTIKNISPLRFFSQPNISILLQTKSFFLYLIATVHLIIPISYIDVNSLRKNFFLLHFDTNTMKSSSFAPIFYLKYLTYQVVTSSFLSLSSTQIFSGSVLTSSLSGTVNARLLSAENYTSSGKYKLYHGTLYIKDIVMDPELHFNINGYNSRVLMYYDTFTNTRNDTATAVLTVKDCLLKPESTSPGDWSIYVDRMTQSIVLYTASNITSSWFSGSVTSGSVISNYTTILETDNISTYTLYNSQLQGTSQSVLTLKVGEYPTPILINGSFLGILLQPNITITSGSVSGSYITQTTNTKYNTIYSLNSFCLFSQLIYIDPESVFFGTVSGVGTGIGVKIGSYQNTLIVNVDGVTSSTTVLNDQLFSMFGTEYTYYGAIRTSKMTTQFISGSIISGSITYKHSNIVPITNQYVNINNYKDYVITMLNGILSIEKCSYFNIQFLNSKYLPHIELSVDSIYSGSNRIYNNSYIYVDTDTSIITKPNLITSPRISDVDGFVSFTNFSGTSSGFFQINPNSIEKYSIYDTVLLNGTDQYFNSRELYFFDDIYSIGYVPIGVKYTNISDLYKNLTMSNSHPVISFRYSFYNTFNNLLKLDLLNLNLYVSASNMVPYSGFINYILIGYRDSLSEMFQHLASVLLLNTGETSIIKNILLPYNNFINRSIDLQFRFIDGNNKYSVTDYDVLIPNVKMLNYILSEVVSSVGYNTSTTTSSGISNISLFTSNGITGQILNPTTTPYIILGLDYITASAILTFGQIHSTVPNGISPFIVDSNTLVLNLNVDMLDGRHADYFARASHSIVFTSPGETASYQIGTTLSFVPITWSTSLTSNPLRQYYTLSCLLYPNTIWNILSSQNLNITDSTLLLSNVSKSMKLDLYQISELSDVIHGTFYIYMKNIIYCGVSVNLTLTESDISSLEFSSIASDYISRFLLTPSTSEYIYFACPAVMTSSVKPVFVVNHILGGFITGNLISYTNEKSYTENYIYYRSYNKNLGLTYLKILNPLYMPSTVYENVIYTSGSITSLSWKNTVKLTSSYLSNIEYMILTGSVLNSISNFNNLSVFVNGFLKMNSSSGIIDWDYKSGSTNYNIIFKYDIDANNTYITYMYTG